ncbi:MAG: hypothetical protein H0T74_15365 [Rubrobacteraceae bacterium]|nr:hypothetical protein [Rubrobacteraceae bacterium]
MRRLLSFLLKWSGILCVPGGVLWALTPTGIYISNLAFHTPNVFWKLFWPAPLLILLGLVGLQLRQSGRSGLLEKLGFFVAILGLVMVIAGDVGLYWLGVDDIFIVTAPAYNAFRLGLLVVAVGSILFGVTSPRDSAVPTWGLLPFVVGSLCGLISFSRDLGSFGAVLWILFGVGWAWLGLSLVVEGFSSFVRTRRATRGSVAVKQ